MADLIGSLIAGIIELLLWIVWEVLPALFYLTAIVLVYAVTLGRVAVAFPKASAIYRSWRRSPDGQIVLSPVLGTIIGFSFWVIVIASAIIAYDYRSGI